MLTLSPLEQFLSKAAWILKGPVDAADFKVYSFPLLFFKRISDVYNKWKDGCNVLREAMNKLVKRIIMNNNTNNSKWIHYEENRYVIR